MTSTSCVTCDQPLPRRAVFCSNCGDAVGSSVVSTVVPPEGVAAEVAEESAKNSTRRLVKKSVKKQNAVPVEADRQVVGVDEPPTAPPLAPDGVEWVDGLPVGTPPTAPPPPMENDRVAQPDDPPGAAPRRTLLIRVGLATVIIVALVAGAALIFRGGGSVGADSPEEAVEIFFQAIDERDYVRLGQIVAPDEAGSAADLVVLFNKRLAEFRLPPVDGSEDGMQVSIRLDRAATIQESGGRAVVDVDGEITFANLPVPDIVSVITGDELTMSFDTFAGVMSRGSQDGLQIIAVEVDGRWYVSPVRTLAVLALELIGIPIVE